MDLDDPTQWYWEYVPGINQWHLHTPCYQPEVSFKVGVLGDNMIAAFHKSTTMPQEVKEVLSKMLTYIDLYHQSGIGITTILIPQDQVISAVGKVQVLKRVLERSKVR